jgi:hypothetical protein
LSAVAKSEFFSLRTLLPCNPVMAAAADMTGSSSQLNLGLDDYFQKKTSHVCKTIRSLSRHRKPIWLVVVDLLAKRAVTVYNHRCQTPLMAG